MGILGSWVAAAMLAGLAGVPLLTECYLQGAEPPPETNPFPASTAHIEAQVEAWDESGYPRDVAEGIALFESLIVQAPHDLNLRMLVALQYLEADRIEDAHVQLQEVERRHGHWNGQYQWFLVAIKGKVAEQRPVELAQAFVSRYPKAAAAYAALGQTYTWADEAEKALTAYRAALRLQPDTAVHSAGIARAHLDLNRLDEALEAMAEAVRLAPESSSLRCEYGAYLAEARRHEEAEAQYREALRITPCSVYAMEGLARALWKRGRSAEADDVAAKTQQYRLMQVQARLADEPESSYRHYQMGEALVVEGQIGKAIESFRSAIRLDPNTTWYYPALLALLDEQGHSDEATALRRQGVEAGKRHVTNEEGSLYSEFRRLGNLYAELGESENAIVAYRQSLTLFPHDAHLWNDLGHLLFAAKETLDAKTAYEESVAIHGDKPVINAADCALNSHYGLGMVYSKLGDADQAEVHWLQAWAAVHAWEDRGERQQETIDKLRREMREPAEAIAAL